MSIYLQGAYGRKYRTMADAMADWNDGKEFKIADGPYCSIRDLDNMVEQYDRVTLVVGNKTKVIGSNIWGDVL